jgi:hypothetical protein
VTIKFKDFGSPIIPSQSDPIQFAIYGKTFECVPNLQGRALLKFISETTSNEYTVSSKAVLTFLDSCLTPESLEDFQKMSADPNTIISMDTLGDITTYLIEAYTNTLFPDSAVPKENAPSTGTAALPMEVMSSSPQLLGTLSPEEALRIPTPTLVQEGSPPPFMQSPDGQLIIPTM